MSTMLKAYPRKRLAVSQAAIAGLITPGARVLEMGCAMGYMTRHLTEQLGCKVTGVEINAEEAAQAEPFAERVVVADLADPRTWELIGDGYDYIIYADVLEHLVDPWEALRRTKDLVADGGSVLASIPNIAHYKIRLGMMMGRFDYANYGILDDTHLRFFTRKSARALFTDTGYCVEKCLPICWSAWKRPTARLMPCLLSNQFVIEARAHRQKE